MKVKDALKQLQKMDPDAIIIMQTHNTMELGQEDVPVQSINENWCKKETKHCVDAFDYTHYQKTVYRHANDNDTDKIKCVRFWA